MDAWLTSSPFWAVGIYISGASRACPASPTSPGVGLHAAPQRLAAAPADGRPAGVLLDPGGVPDDVRINPKPRPQLRGAPACRAGGGGARRFGRPRPSASPKRSTLWYDIEAFPIAGTDAANPHSVPVGWTRQLHELHYVSGVYSSAASGIKILDDA